MASKLYSKEIIESVIYECDSLADVMRALGKRPSGSLHNYLSGLIRRYEIDTSYFTFIKNNTRKSINNRLKPEEILILIEDSTKGRMPGRLLTRALVESGIEYKCSNADCGISEWRGKKITLDVDHIDGNFLDCRIGNLRFLCPNCHRQTSTFGRKKESLNKKDNSCKCGRLIKPNSKTCATCYANRVKIAKENKYYCSIKNCGKELKTKATYCPSCYHESRRGVAGKAKITWSPIDELITLLQASNYTQLSKQLGVTDNAIRKHLRNAGYDTKTLTKTI
jgi:hypothetical protein